MKRETIMVVEDEPDLVEVICHNLKREGYVVCSSREGDDALRQIQETGPDLVLLDLMLPGLDGIEICKRLKAKPLTRDIPIIMLTAKGEESDVVLGLGVGADDYIVKPFTLRALIARVQAVLRRGPLRQEAAAGERLVRGSLIIDVARHEVLLDDEPLALTATEMRLLHLLASNPGRVFTRDQILNRVIGERSLVINRNVDAHVKAVRKKLGDHRHRIETVRGVGYRFQDRETGA